MQPRPLLPDGEDAPRESGDGGGSADKPVGTVWFGWCLDGRVSAECRRFDGDRSQVRAQTVVHALQGLLARLQVQV